MAEKKHTILVTDNDQDFCDVLVLAFNMAGFIIHQEYNKSKAHSWTNENIPDLIISNIKSQGLNGFEFLNLLKENPRTKEIPFVFLSAVDDPSAEKKAKEMGAAGYLIKPYEIEKLLEVVKKIIVDHYPDAVFPAAETGIEQWSILKQNFVARLKKISERTEILSNSSTGGILFIFDYAMMIIGGMLCNPSGVDGLAYSDVLTFRYYLDILNLQQGMILAYSDVSPLVNRYADLLGIIVMDKKKIAPLLSAIESDKYIKYRLSLFNYLMFEVDHWGVSDDFRIFLAKMQMEFRKLKNTTLTVDITYGEKPHEVIVSNVSGYEITFTDSKLSRDFVVKADIINYIIAALWINGSILKDQLKIGEVEKACISSLLSNISELQIDDDLIMLLEK